MVDHTWGVGTKAHGGRADRDERIEEEESGKEAGVQVGEVCSGKGIWSVSLVEVRREVVLD